MTCKLDIIVYAKFNVKKEEKNQVFPGAGLVYQSHSPLVLTKDLTEKLLGLTRGLSKVAG